MLSTSVLMSLFVFGLSGASCPKVPIYDHEICGDKGELGARCRYWLSDGLRNLPLEQWDEERFGQMCMKPDAYSNITAALLKLCESSGRCSWQEKQDLKNLEKKISKFKKETKADAVRVGMK